LVRVEDVRHQLYVIAVGMTENDVIDSGEPWSHSLDVGQHAILVAEREIVIRPGVIHESEIWTSD
jgi:hypothetical protein